MASMRLNAGGIRTGTTYGRIDSSNISMKDARLKREKARKQYHMKKLGLSKKIDI